MHDNPDDMAAVLRDYGTEMILPALEIYTHGLMTDAAMYDAFLARKTLSRTALTRGPSGG